MGPTDANSSRVEFFKPGTGSALALLSDQELERRLSNLAARESEATADVVEHIAEFERRRLYAPKSFPSMFEYCTKVLGYSEGAAYLRIYAGRLAAEYPEVLELLRNRRLHLTAVRAIGPHLNASNRQSLLSAGMNKTERELKFLIAAAAPKAEPNEVIRRLPAPSPPSSDAAEPTASGRPDAPISPAPAAPRSDHAPIDAAPRDAVPASRIEPLSADRVRFAFTGSPSFLQRVDRARQLLKRQYPSGTLEDIFWLMAGSCGQRKPYKTKHLMR